MNRRALPIWLIAMLTALTLIAPGCIGTVALVMSAADPRMM